MNQWLLDTPDALNNIGKVLSTWNVSHPLVVTGKRFAATFPAKYLSDISHTLFSGYHPNPDDADCVKGAALYNQMGCDCIISLGGGSAMDTAKCIKAYLMTGFQQNPFEHPMEDMILPHLAIPATAGTGSEGNRFAVVYRKGVKHSLADPRLMPEAAILAPELLRTLPPYHKRSCALDALYQGIESYWATSATIESQQFATLAIKGVLQHLDGYLSGSEAGAAGMLRAAYESGRAIDVTRTTAPHAMSYQLTTNFGIAHGHAVALTIPYVWEHMLAAPLMTQTLQQLCGLMNIPSPKDAPAFLRSLLQKLDLPIPPMPPAQVIKEMALGVNVDRLQNHPVPLTQAQVCTIYGQAFTPLGSSSCPVAGI